MRNATSCPELRFHKYKREWVLAKLDTEVDKVGSGVTPKGGKEVYVNEGVPLIRSQNVRNDGLDLTDVVFITKDVHQSMSGSVVKPNDVLLNITGASIGRSCVVPEGTPESNVNQHVCIIRCKKSCEPKFIQAFISSWYGQRLIYQSQAGGGREGINFENIRSFKIYFPELQEQQKIASFLGSIDEKLNKFRRKRELLEIYKRGVMQKIFSQELRFKKKGGGDFPDWEEVKLGSLTRKSGKKNKDNLKLPIYSISNKHGFIPQSDQFEGVDSNERGYDISLYKIIEENTFAYNPARINVGSIGFSGDLSNVIVSSLYVCFKTTGDLEDRYLLQYLDTFDFNKSVLRNVEGGVREYLFYENFSAIKIPLPTVPEQKRIIEYLEAIDNKIEVSSKQVEHLETFKKALLQKMFI